MSVVTSWYTLQIGLYISPVEVSLTQRNYAWALALLRFEPPLIRDGRHSNSGHVLTVQVLESEPDNQAHSKGRERKAKSSTKTVRSRRVVLDNPPSRTTGSHRGQTVPLYDSQSWRNPGGPIGPPASDQTAGYATAKPAYAGQRGPPRAQRLINLEIPVLVRSLKSSNVELG